MLVPAENRNSPRAPQIAKVGGLPLRGDTMAYHAIPPNVAPRPTTKAADASVNSAKSVRRNAQRLHPKQSATSLPPPLRPPAAVGQEKIPGPGAAAAKVGGLPGRGNTVLPLCTPLYTYSTPFVLLEGVHRRKRKIVLREVPGITSACPGRKHEFPPGAAGCKGRWPPPQG